MSNQITLYFRDNEQKLIELAAEKNCMSVMDFLHEIINEHFTSPKYSPENRHLFDFIEKCQQQPEERKCTL